MSHRNQWPQESLDGSWTEGQQFGTFMPQPTYDNGFPQPIRQPMYGSSAAVSFATSKSLKAGVSSVLWMILGWIVVIGPVVAIIQGIRAVIHGVKELILSRYVGGLGVGAAILGIILGLFGGGVPSAAAFMFGRAAYIYMQADLNDQEVVMDEEEDAWNLFVYGKPHLVDKTEYYAEEDEYGYGSDESQDTDGMTVPESPLVTEGSDGSPVIEMPEDAIE